MVEREMETLAEVNALPGIKTKRMIMEKEEEREGEAMTPVGRVFSEARLNIHIICILGFQHPLHLPSFKAHIQLTLLKHKRFNAIPKRDKKGKLYWVPTQVNLDEHFIIPEEDVLSEKEDKSFVEDYVAKLTQASPLDPSRPLWELHVLNYKLGDASSNVILRVHHSVGDGISLMSLLLACTRRVDEPKMLPTIPSHSTRYPPKRNILVNMLLLLWKLFLVIWYTLSDVCRFFATTLWLSDSETPIKGFPGVEHLPRDVGYITISFEDLAIVKKAVNSTINDVALGLFSAGVTRYLLSHIEKKVKNKSDEADGLEHQNKSFTSIKNLRIRASSLVNIRQSPGLQELQNMMEKGTCVPWGNHIACMILPIHVDQHSETLEYIRRMKAICDRKKISLEAPFIYASGSLLMNLAGSKVAAKVTYDSTSHVSLSISNVVGPVEQVQICGNPITHILPTVCGQPQALCLHVQSYMRKVTLIFSVAKDVIPDLNRLMSHMTCALEEMKQEAKSMPANR